MSYTSDNQNKPAGEPELTDHAYDGIQEYDNPAPGWWSLLFFICFVFSIVYILVMHFSIFATSPQLSWEDAKAAYYEKVFGEIGELEGNAATLVEMANEEQWMVLGKGVFESNCVACHGSGGIGGTGPNLTDNYWLHAKELEDLYTIVKTGVVAKGMPAWDKSLSQNQVVLVAAYVASLNANPVDSNPQGDDIGPWDLTPLEGDVEGDTEEEGEANAPVEEQAMAGRE